MTMGKLNSFDFLQACVTLLQIEAETRLLNILKGELSRANI
jgi:hypothetical protein